MITIKSGKTALNPRRNIGKLSVKKNQAYCTYSTDSIALLAACLTQPRSIVE